MMRFTPRIEVDTLSPEEREQIRTHAPPKIALLSELLYKTGCRVSELLKLKLSDCVIQGKACRLEVTGKYGKRRFVFIYTREYNRVVKLYGSREYLFQGRVRHINRSYVDRALKSALQRSHAHLFRHSRATDLIAKGKPLDAVSRFLGHADVGITLRLYSWNKLDQQTMLEV